MSSGYPYRTIPRDLVRPGPWILVDATSEVERPLPPLHLTWDYATDLTLRRHFDLDLEHGLAATRLGADVQLDLAIIWTAGQHLRGTAARQTLRTDGAERATIELTLPGRNLGGVLTLASVITLRNRGPGATAVAEDVGSVLWEDRVRCQLQGDSPRFPIAILDFATRGYDTRAPWFLEIRPDLESPVAGAVHLLVNERNARAVAAVSAPGSKDADSALILSAMFYDAGRTLIEFALGQPEFTQRETFEEGTLGAALQALVSRTLPNESVSGLRTKLQADPSSLAAAIAGSLGLLGAAE